MTKGLKSTITLPSDSFFWLLDKSSILLIVNHSKENSNSDNYCWQISILETFSLLFCSFLECMQICNFVSFLCLRQGFISVLVFMNSKFELLLIYFRWTLHMLHLLRGSRLSCWMWRTMTSSRADPNWHCGLRYYHVPRKDSMPVELDLSFSLSFCICCFRSWTRSRLTRKPELILKSWCPQPRNGLGWCPLTDLNLLNPVEFLP